MRLPFLSPPDTEAPAGEDAVAAARTQARRRLVGALVLLLVGVVLIIQISLGIGAWVEADGALGLRDAPAPHGVDNARALGLILYDKYGFLFQIAGLILLVAMIGAILLTLRHRKDIKRQNVLQQMWRDPAKAMELKDVKPGQGL